MASEFYFPPDETLAIRYEVTVKPPPVDVARVTFYKQEVGGEVLREQELSRESQSGRVSYELTDASVDDSPVWAELVFSKEKAQEPEQTCQLVFSLAEPAVAAVEAPADAKVGEEVEVEVSEWGALAYDEPGRGTFFAGVEPERIAQAKRDAVRWRVDGEDREETGERLRLKVERRHLGKTLEIEAYLGDAPPGRAKAQVAVPRVRVVQDDEEETRPEEVHLQGSLPLKVVVTPEVEGELAWSCDSERVTLKPDGERAVVEGLQRSGAEKDVKVRCTLTSKATGNEYG